VQGWKRGWHRSGIEQAAGLRGQGRLRLRIGPGFDGACENPGNLK
jgi:hypothetical protein